MNRIRRGELHWNARYTDGEVSMTIALRQCGYGYKRIAAICEMPVRTVRDYVNGLRRKHAGLWLT